MINNKSALYFYLFFFIGNIYPVLVDLRYNNIVVSSDIQFSDSVLIICDMWDKHWCKCMYYYSNILSKRIDSFLPIIRKLGVKIIHAPSDTMLYYKNNMGRRRMKKFKLLFKKLFGFKLHLKSLDLINFPLTCINGGCGCNPTCYKNSDFIKQNDLINIDPDDLISDDFEEIYCYMKLNHKKTIFYTGVHLDRCILKRSFGVINMVNYFKCIIVRDLVDSSYYYTEQANITHLEANSLICRYIEREYCPSVESSGL